ncbi:hypothetical protein K2X33_04840 [bacterium]|nr:hypothetical protein [bacterium]
MWLCHYCRHPLTLDTQRKNQLCPNCGSDIHSCKNCLNYDENTSTQCREPNSPWVADRSKTNECPFFELRPASSSTPAAKDAAATEAEKAKEAFRALFRDL